MVTNYNLGDENMFNFLDDDDDERKLIESQLEGERIRGEKRGLKLGIEKNKIQTTKKMLKKHFALQDIQDITGLKKDFLETIEI